MKKIHVLLRASIMLAICFILSQGLSLAQDLPQVEIEGVTIVPPSGNETAYRIQTTVMNKGNTPIPASRLQAQRYQGTAVGEWAPSGSTGLSEPLGPQEMKIIWGNFNRNASKDHMKVVLFYNNEAASVALGEKIVPLPAEAVPQFDVINCLFDEGQYTATIQNLADKGISDLVVKGATSNDARFGRWMASEEATVVFLKAKGTYEYTGTLPKDHTVVKIIISRGGKKIGEKIIDSKASTTIKNITDVKKGGLPNMSLPRIK